MGFLYYYYLFIFVFYLQEFETPEQKTKCPFWLYYNKANVCQKDYSLLSFTYCVFVFVFVWCGVV